MPASSRGARCRRGATSRAGASFASFTRMLDHSSRSEARACIAARGARRRGNEPKDLKEPKEPKELKEEEEEESVSSKREREIAYTQRRTRRVRARQVRGSWEARRSAAAALAQ